MAPASPPSPLRQPARFPVLTGATVLQVIPELGAGGAERTVLEMVEALREAGARAIVVSSGGRLVGDVEALGGEHIRMNVKSKNPAVVWQNAGRLAALVRSRGVDLIHARSRAPAWSGLWAARRTRTPFITTYHGAYHARSRLKRLYNSVMVRGARVIANSQWTAAHIQAEHAVGPPRLVTIPRGVDLMAFDPDAVSPERTAAKRRDFAGSDRDGVLVILLPGRLTRWKGQGLALEAFVGLTAEERAGLRLVLLGDAQGRTAYVGELTDAVDDAGLNASVRLMPHTGDMPAAYLASDIVLAPSLRPEAFGRTAAEAGALARPVIAADHGGARETVIEGETGIRFAPGDAAELTAALRTLISLGPGARAAMGQAARAYVTNNFAKRGMQAATLNVYSGVLGGTESKV
ncbi:MAG: glycosyltransferase family 4 protein [Pseudomonadota bacterium]